MYTCAVLHNYIHVHTIIHIHYVYIHVGLLSISNESLSLRSDKESVYLQWKPPFSLNVTGVEPDISYTLFIYNVTGENPVLLESHNLTESHYIFTPLIFSPCQDLKYDITVVPLNGAGEGTAVSKVGSLGRFSCVVASFLVHLHTCTYVHVCVYYGMW